MALSEVVVIGKTPPPIGGVTIHVSRLKEHLEESAIPFSFIELNKNNLWKFLKSFHTYKIIHLHTSSVWLRIVASIYSKAVRKKLLITFHGALGRYGHFYNWLDKVSLKFSFMPIVLNKSSLDTARQLNKNSKLISAFLPPKDADIEKNEDVEIKVNALKEKYAKVYCTNAFNVTFDRLGDEIYGISDLVKLFSSIDNAGLVISDPSGNYKKYILKLGLPIKDNILFIGFPHSFFNVIKLTDGFIRSTTTDGDSLSVKEALYVGKPVFCSDCVDRPIGVTLFKTSNYDDLRILLVKHLELKVDKCGTHIENGFDQLKQIYSELLFGNKSRKSA